MGGSSAYRTPEEALGVSTIPQALERAARTANGITVLDRDLGECRRSYVELEDAARRAAGGLRANGVGPGDPVCLLSSTSLELLVALFGVWRAGAIPSVLALPRRTDLETYLEDVAGRIDAAGAKLLLVADELLSPDLPLDRVSAPTAGLRELADAAPIDEPTPSDPGAIALLQFTSGTTAGSRAVTLTHRHILTNIVAAVHQLGADKPETVIVSWLPLFHDMGLIGMLLGSVSSTCPFYVLPPEEFMARPGSWMDAMSRYHGTTSAAPNFGYGLAARDLRLRPRKLDLSSLTGAGSGAEAIDHDTVESFTREAGKYGFRPEHFCPMYGRAENTLAVSGKPPGDDVITSWVRRDELEKEGVVAETRAGDPDARALVSNGPALPGVEIAILDEDGRRLGPGRVGEICVGGPAVMAGYWRNEEKTAEAIRDGLLHTGDLGYLDARGELFVTGRIKDIIIVGGRNLAAEDYEFWAERVDGVRRGNAIAFAVPDREQVVVVAETAAPAGEADAVARSVMETLRDRLPRGPEEVVLVLPGTLPKTSSGKRKRSVCREQYASGTLQTVAVVTRKEG
jgi:fatty-acyl-CoA synthase